MHLFHSFPISDKWVEQEKMAKTETEGLVSTKSDLRKRKKTDGVHVSPHAPQSHIELQKMSSTGQVLTVTFQ